MKMPVTVTVVSALNCEAKAIVDRFSLKKVSHTPFALFSGTFNSDGQAVTLRVLISGIGLVNIATAVGWCAAQTPAQLSDKANTPAEWGSNPEKTVWLNVGIAGHGELSVGDAFIVTASRDQLSQKTYYPPQVSRRPVKSDACMSLNAPSTDYPEKGGLDMEVSAFYSSAIRFTDAEYVQAFKVVSDTPDHGPDNLNAKKVQELLQPHTKDIERYIMSLVKSVTLNSSVFNTRVTECLLSAILPRLRASYSQRTQCEQLAKKLSYFLEDDSIIQVVTDLSATQDIKASLVCLESSLNSYEPQLKNQ